MRAYWILAMSAAVLAVLSGFSTAYLVVGGNMFLPIGATSQAASCDYTPQQRAAAAAELTNSGCTDSDGGISFYVMGTTEGKDGKKSDKCADWTGNYNRDWVREYYCTPKGYTTLTEYQCPNGCEGGACIGVSSAPAQANQPASVQNTQSTEASNAPASVNGCSDSDGGMDYSAKGSVSDKTGVVKTDFCVTGKYRGQLREYYCGENGYVASTDVICTGNCRDGACNGEGYTQMTPTAKIYNH
jgi:hypothetical protein